MAKKNQEKLQTHCMIQHFSAFSFNPLSVMTISIGCQSAAAGHVDATIVTHDPALLSVAERGFNPFSALTWDVNTFRPLTKCRPATTFIDVRHCPIYLYFCLYYISLQLPTYRSKPKIDCCTLVKYHVERIRALLYTYFSQKY